jgi:lipopolysaccharide transport system permease protein
MQNMAPGLKHQTLKRDLVLASTMTRRKITEQYRGSLLGVIWALLTPLLMLLVFTFVFGVVFQSRWQPTSDSIVEFAIIIFCGLTTFSIFSGTVSSAPTLVTGQRNLVKKIVFPLHILPLVSLGDALFDALIAFGILIVLQIMFGSGIHITMLLLPVLLLPLCLFVLGVAWFLAAFGVYVRDVRLIIQPLITALMFLSAVFYPLSALPSWLQPALVWNPLSSSIEMVRNALVFGVAPDALVWGGNFALGLVVTVLGLTFFQSTRRGFPDVM